MKDDAGSTRGEFKKAGQSCDGICTLEPRWTALRQRDRGLCARHPVRLIGPEIGAQAQRIFWLGRVERVEINARAAGNAERYGGRAGP